MVKTFVPLGVASEVGKVHSFAEGLPGSEVSPDMISSPPPKARGPGDKANGNFWGKTMAAVRGIRARYRSQPAPGAESHKELCSLPPKSQPPSTKGVGSGFESGCSPKANSQIQNLYLKP